MIHQWNPDIADDLLNKYEDFRLVFEWAVQEANTVLDIELDVDVWIENLPPRAECTVGEYRASDVGDYLAVQGQISKVGTIRFKATELAFECQRCGTLNYIPQTHGSVDEVHDCQGCDRKGPFQYNAQHSEFEDRLLLRLKQPVEEVADGNGAKIDVVVKESLEQWFTDRELSSGARITVNGKLEIDQSSGEDDGAFKPYLEADCIEVEEQDYEEINTAEHLEDIRDYADDPDVFEKLVESIAPDIKGGQKMRDIKLTIALQMFGGYRRQKPDGTWIRGDSHVLLIGDPSTGKSSLLDAVQEIAPRSVKASGKGASAAGMTAAAVKDDFGDDQFNLEAGALALANGGIAAVDEIGRMQDDAVDSMHDALERQKISVNKAGINAEVPARTAVVAAGNPKYDRFDRYEPIYEQVELDDALWSRFDLAFIMKDEQDEDRDRMIAEGKVETWQESARMDRGELEEEDAVGITPAIPHETLRAYIAHAKRRIQPVVSDAAGQEIVSYYVDIRGEGDEDTPSLAARKLEGIRRLAEASARVRLSETVEVEDVERAKQVIGRSLADVGMNEDGELDADIMETGTSTSQRDRIRNLDQLVANVEAEYEDGAPVEVVVERAGDELGLEVGKVEHEIEKLKQKGEMYEPETDHLRTT
jgi:replicative DNA helicase Mcm